MLAIRISKKKWQAVLIGALFAVAGGLLVLSNYVDDFSTSAVRERIIAKLEKEIHKQQHTLEALSHRWIEHMQQKPSVPFVPTNEFTELEDDKNRLLFGFENDTMRYWSSNVAITEQQLRGVDTLARYLKMGSSWNSALKTSDEEGSYVAQAYVNGKYKVVTLLLIRTDYTYRNEFLESGFNPSLPFPSSAIVASLSDGGQVVKDRDGRPLFTLSVDVATNTIDLPLVMRWIGLVLLMLAFTVLSITVSSRAYPFLPSLCFAALLVLARIYLYGNPLFTEGGGNMFSPMLYAASDLLPSLGDLLVSVFFFFLLTAVIFYNRTNAGYYVRMLGKAKRLVLVVCLAVAIGFIAVSIHHIFVSLIVNSNIPLEPYRLSEVSSYTFIVYGILAVMFSSLMLLLLYFFGLFSDFKARWMLPGIVLPVCVLTLLLNECSFTTLSFLLFYALCAILSYMCINKRLRRVRYVVLTSLLVSLYVIVVVALEASKREWEERKVVALNLSNQRDPVAEVLFRDLSDRMANDATLTDLIQDPEKNYAIIYSRLSDVYFSGYFKHYSLRQVNICPHEGLLRLADEEKTVSCWDFYNQITKTYGGGSIGSFSFINNNNGRINYLGRVVYPSSKYEGGIGLFIDLSSKSENQQIGYPELLLEQKADLGVSGSSKNYSYAKYFDGKRVSVHGSYSYGYELADTSVAVGGYIEYSANRFKHLQVRYDEHNTVIVSLPRLRASDFILCFSYVFLFFVVSIALILMLGGFSLVVADRRITFKRRITLMFLVLLTLSFAATGSSILLYNIRQFKKNNIAGIAERMNMVLFEFDRRYADAHSLASGDYTGISNWLVDLSNIYRTDINIYTTDGHLLASSRQEIFDRGLQGDRMNAKAFRTITYGNLSRHVDTESVGSMSYYSAYTPYYNSSNEELGIINLPYFAKQAELRQELSSLIIAVLNIFMLLTVLAWFVALAISNRLARPLESVRKGMKKLDLSGMPKPIAYNGKDELGDLVREYNRVIVELADSAQQLAQTERESAWREMARQIAHEIKNPLTPMRLSIQHVMRMKREGVPGWESKLEGLSKSLLEQIDTLAATASEFSSFAKITRVELAKLRLVDLLQEQRALFAGYENIDMQLHCSAGVFVMAQREQLQRVFTNLIKNAVQAIGDKEDGQIAISVTAHDDTCLVAIDDNGQGISVEQQKNLFRPNFTTKTGGTGLGLAISKSIVESIGGSLSYSTSPLGGARFTVALPLYRSE